jgi:GWxTD domain-containing protein
VTAHSFKSTSRVILGLALVSLWVPRFASAEKLDRAAEEWLKDVHLLILPEEEKVFRELKDAADRKEFERIFWERRDPDPTTPANEARDSWEKARKKADELFAVPGERGSRTGCGQVYLLLGDPHEAAGRNIEVYGTHFHAKGDNRLEGNRTQGETHDIGETTYRSLKEGPRQPETWIYRSRPGDAFEFVGGELRISLDESCRLSEGGVVLDELRRAARARVSLPQLAYTVGSDGHLARSAPPAPGRTAAVIDEKHDFPLAAEVKLLLRSQGGEPYAAGLLRAEPGASTSAAPGGPEQVRVAAQALDADGRVAASTDRQVRVSPGADGSFVASFGLVLKPGQYTLRAAAFTAGDARGAVTSVPLEVPDFRGPALTLSPPLVYTRADVPTADPNDPYAAFALLHLAPRFGNVFRTGDQLEAVCVLYGAGVNPATGKASVKARYSFLRDGRSVARGEEESFETKDAVASVGPVPLAGFAPGHYLARLDVTDAVSGTTSKAETAFEIVK